MDKTKVTDDTAERLDKGLLKILDTPGAFLGALGDRVAESDIKGIEQILDALSKRFPDSPFLREKRLTVYMYIAETGERISSMQPLEASTHQNYSLEIWHMKVYKDSISPKVDYFILNHLHSLYSTLKQAKEKISKKGVFGKGRLFNEVKKDLRCLTELFPRVHNMPFDDLEYILDRMPRIKVTPPIERDYGETKVRITEKVQAPIFFDLLPEINKVIKEGESNECYGVAVKLKEGIRDYVSKSTAFLHSYLPIILAKLQESEGITIKNTDFSENFKHAFNLVRGYFNVKFSSEELKGIEESFDAFNSLFKGAVPSFYRDPNPRHYLIDIGKENWKIDIQKTLDSKEHDKILKDIVRFVIEREKKGVAISQIIKDIVVECDFEKLLYQTIEVEDSCQATEHDGWNYDEEGKKIYGVTFLTEKERVKSLLEWMANGSIERAPKKYEKRDAKGYIDKPVVTNESIDSYFDYKGRFSPYRYFKSGVNRLVRNLKESEEKLRVYESGLIDCLDKEGRSQFAGSKTKPLSNFPDAELAMHVKNGKKESGKFIGLYKTQRAEKEEYEKRIYDYYLRNSITSFDTLISNLSASGILEIGPENNSGIIEKLKIIRDAVDRIMQSSINYDKLLTYQNGN